MTGFEKLNEKIISDAKNTADGIICKAQEDIAALLREYEGKKDEAHREIFEAALQQAEEIKVEARAKAQREYDAIVKSHKDRVVADAVDAAANEIVSFKDEKYIAFMSGLLAKVLYSQMAYEKECLESTGENIAPEQYVLVLRKKDRDAHGEKIIAALRRVTVGKIPASVLDKVVLSSRTASVKGGFILEAGDMKIDASIDAIIENIKREYGDDISSMLFDGEAK